MDNIVVSFDGRFGSGQAYVAFSRARTLAGLYIINLDITKLTINKRCYAEDIEGLPDVLVDKISLLPDLLKESRARN
ncbi:hypothetical protein MAR_017194, partial [Mya arenaria]